MVPWNGKRRTRFASMAGAPLVRVSCRPTTFSFKSGMLGSAEQSYQSTAGKPHCWIQTAPAAPSWSAVAEPDSQKDWALAKDWPVGKNWNLVRDWTLAGPARPDRLATSARIAALAAPKGQRRVRRSGVFIDVFILLELELFSPDRFSADRESAGASGGSPGWIGGAKPSGSWGGMSHKRRAQRGGQIFQKDLRKFLQDNRSSLRSSECALVPREHGFHQWPRDGFGPAGAAEGLARRRELGGLLPVVPQGHPRVCAAPGPERAGGAGRSAGYPAVGRSLLTRVQARCQPVLLASLAVENRSAPHGRFGPAAAK